MRMQIEKSQNYYHLIISSLASMLIIISWEDSTHHLLLLILLATILLYLALNYVLPISYSERSKHPYSGPSADYFITGMLLALADFDYTFVLIVSGACAVSVLGYRLKFLFINISLVIIGAIIGYWLLPQSISPSPVAIICSVLVVGVYGLLLMDRALRDHALMVDQLSAANIEIELLNNRAFQLSEYISPTVRRAIFSGVKLKKNPEEKHVSIFFSDIVGFTRLTEQLTPDNLNTFLNTYLSEMSKIAVRFGGTIDKIMGDSIMVFFGDPRSRGVKNDAVSCVSMALAMKKSMAELQSRWQLQGIETPPSIRIGINSGLCRVGNFGSAFYLNYTLLGRSVNLASRLETAASAGEILISLSTYNLVKHKIHCINKGEVSVNGFSQPLLVYSVLGLIEQDKKTLSDQPISQT